jgi:hypothetical protein
LISGTALEASCGRIKLAVLVGRSIAEAEAVLTETP